MSQEDREARSFSPRIAVIVVIAGLLTGGVIVWVLNRPGSADQPAPDYPVAESQRLPMRQIEREELEAREQALVPRSEQAASDAEAAEEGPTGSGNAEPPAEAEAAVAPQQQAPSEPDGGRDDRVVDQTEDLQEALGVECVELTEELYIRISARVAALAHMISTNPDAFPDASETLEAFLRDELVRNRVDAREYKDYTDWVASDHERAQRIGAKITREAARHVPDHRIRVDGVPGLSPAPVAPPEE